MINWGAFFFQTSFLSLSLSHTPLTVLTVRGVCLRILGISPLTDVTHIPYLKQRIQTIIKEPQIIIITGRNQNKCNCI